MKKAAGITGAYGLLVLIGGIMGHVKAASTVSLVMGILFGLLLLGSSLLMMRKKIVGLYAAIGTLLVLDAFFTYRFLKTLRFFPSGLFAILSLVVLALLILLLRKRRA